MRRIFWHLLWFTASLYLCIALYLECQELQPITLRDALSELHRVPTLGRLASALVLYLLLRPAIERLTNNPIKFRWQARKPTEQQLASRISVKRDVLVRIGLFESTEPTFKKSLHFAICEAQVWDYHIYLGTQSAALNIFDTTPLVTCSIANITQDFRRRELKKELQERIGKLTGHRHFRDVILRGSLDARSEEHAYEKLRNLAKANNLRFEEVVILFSEDDGEKGLQSTGGDIDTAAKQLLYTAIDAVLDEEIYDFGYVKEPELSRPVAYTNAASDQALKRWTAFRQQVQNNTKEY